jgi:hypothetical protein
VQAFLWLPGNHASDADSAVLDLLVTEREGALAEATRLRNQLHQLLLLLDPLYKQHLPALTTKAGLDALVLYTTTSERMLDQQRAEAIRRLAKRLRLALEQAAELETGTSPNYRTTGDGCS